MLIDRAYYDILFNSYHSKPRPLAAPLSATRSHKTLLI